MDIGSSNFVTTRVERMVCYSRGMDKLDKLILKRMDEEEHQKYISREFQDYGYRLAVELGEESRKAMYIKLAKTKPRAILEKARSYVIDYPNAKNKGKLFLWKIKQLEEAAATHQDGRGAKKL